MPISLVSATEDVSQRPAGTDDAATGYRAQRFWPRLTLRHENKVYVFLRAFSFGAHYFNMDHIADVDFERYHLGMVTDETELASIEEHLLGCHACQQCATESDDYVDLIRAALTAFDVGTAPGGPRGSRVR